MSVKYLVPVFLFVFCYCFTFTNQQQPDPEFLKLYNESNTACIQESKVNPQLIEQIWKDMHFPNDDKLKCYFKCMNLKLGIMDESGDVKDDGLKKVISEFETTKQADEILAECKDIKGSDLCETSYKLISCILQAKRD